MRILLAIPHFYDPAGDARYSSASAAREQRALALSACILAMHQVFGKRQYLLDIARRLAVPVNQHQGHDLDVVVATAGDRHLLPDVLVPRELFRQAPVEPVQPLLLAYECHAILRDGLASGYDLFGYLEEDLVVQDPLFLAKILWFAHRVGEDSVLLPRRYELAGRGEVHKLFLDGAIRKQATQQWQNVDDRPEIHAQVLDQPLRFVRPFNPHSGCFFLTSHQMSHWAAQPYFLDRDASFIGPLESAASLGIMRTFRVYKPAPENADFLQIWHHDQKHLNSLGRQVRIANE